MDQGQNEPFLYNPPKRRAIAASADDSDTEFMRPFLRSRFRRSEYRIQKLTQQLARRSGQKQIDYEEEEGKETHTRSTTQEEDANSSCEGKEVTNDASQSQDDASRQRQTQSPVFSFVTRNVHSSILNKRLSLIENVQKNYIKYIRPPETANERPVTSPILQCAPDERKLRRLSSSGAGLLFEDDSSTLVSRRPTFFSTLSFEKLERETSKGNLTVEREISSGSPSRAYSASSALSEENVFLLGNSSEGLKHRRSFTALPQIVTPENVVSVERKSSMTRMNKSDDHWKNIIAIAGAKKLVRNLVRRRRERNTSDTAKRIREIHRQMGLSQRRSVRNAREDAILNTLQGNKNFQSEMQIIMETLEEINIRLDKQLNLLNGDDMKKRKLQIVKQISQNTS